MRASLSDSAGRLAGACTARATPRAVLRHQGARGATSAHSGGELGEGGMLAASASASTPLATRALPAGPTQVAAHEAARRCAVLVVLNDDIHLARYVYKRDSTLMGAFTSHPGVIGGCQA